METLGFVVLVWLNLFFAAGVIAWLRGGRPLPWMAGTLLFPPMILWVMVMPLPPRRAS